MSKIISISTAVPEYRHEQRDILAFTQEAYGMDEREKRKLTFLYDQSGIHTRYSVLADCGFYPATENMELFPNIESRMKRYNDAAPGLSLKAIEGCINGTNKRDITHLVTVSCTGMTAPGLEIQIMEEMGLPNNISKTSVNFMGCYAAIHALKHADAICNNDITAKVLIVCTELCTLHFQKENSIDNITSSLLFGDGAAAILVGGNDNSNGLRIKSFYSEVSPNGKTDMRWELSSTGFLMTLSGNIPNLLEQGFSNVAKNAFERAGIKKDDISHWCIHPGGKKILSAVEKAVGITSQDLRHSYNILKKYGNMSSPTLLFVLKDILEEVNASGKQANIFGAAFGPGLTTETFILSND